MALQRYEIAAARAVRVVLAYERMVRGATVESVEHGLDLRTSAFLEARGVECPITPSADLISLAPEGDRLIEIKGRGGRGPIKVIERQLETMQLAPALVWLYVVFGVTQPQSVELLIVRDPGSLPWQETRAATRPPTEFRGVRHMAEFEVWLELDDSRVDRVDTSGLAGLGSWMGEARD